MTHKHAHDHEQNATPLEEALTCPVMKGIPVNRKEAEENGWIREYKGKKIYFCCKSCVEQFDADPGAYIE